MDKPGRGDAPTAPGKSEESNNLPLATTVTAGTSTPNKRERKRWESIIRSINLDLRKYLSVLAPRMAGIRRASEERREDITRPMGRWT